MSKGEVRIREFTGNFEPVLRAFPEKDKNGNVVLDAEANPKKVQKIRYEYEVIDLNHRERGPIIWPVSKQTSKSIDEFLEEGLTTLKVRLEGNDFLMKHYFVPVTNGTA